RIETSSHWFLTGVYEDLNRAMENAGREAVHFLASQTRVPLSRAEAYSLASMVADCRVSQVVDIRKGVHCMIPKSIFVAPWPTRPRGARRAAPRLDDRALAREPAVHPGARG